MIQRRGQHDQNLIADTIQDLYEVTNASMGSTVYVIETAEKYMANSSGQWVRQTVSTNGGGGEGSVIDPTQYAALVANVETLNEVSSWGSLGN